MTCVYINPNNKQFLIIDDRIYDRAGDGKAKLGQVRDMLEIVTNYFAKE